MMDAVYNEPSRPHMQVPVNRIKNRTDQELWIVVIANEVTYQLALVSYKTSEGIKFEEWSGELPYSEFWHHIKRLQLPKTKHWIIGYQMRFLLERTFVLQALEKGEINLPKRKNVNSTKKRAGKLTHSANCLEIDLVVGKNKVKVLDWDNFGVTPGPYNVQINAVTPQAAEKTMNDFFDACDDFGFYVNRTTTAQLGWAKYRHCYLPPILNVNMSIPTRELERRSYFGGRNEPYFLGDAPGKAYLLDVNGYYASLCLKHTFPVHCSQEYYAGIDPHRIDATGEDHWIADCIIKTDEPDYPVRWAGLPVYPIGTFRTTLAWPELRHAIYAGRVKRVLKAVCYRADHAFARYARWYLNKRATLGDGPCKRMEHLLKSSFNASLGYTARRKYRCVDWQTDIGLDWFLGSTPNPETHGELVQCQILEGEKQWVKVGGEPREAMPFLHTTLCSYGRMELLRLMTLAGRENVLYADTDGLIVNEAGFCALGNLGGVFGEKPGQVAMRFPSGPARIQGQKNYKIGDQVVCAGLVRTRHSSWEEKTVLTTTTGRPSAGGRVYPFEMTCTDEGGEGENWRNELA